MWKISEKMDPKYRNVPFKPVDNKHPYEIRGLGEHPSQASVVFHPKKTGANKDTIATSSTTQLFDAVKSYSVQLQECYEKFSDCCSPVPRPFILKLRVTKQGRVSAASVDLDEVDEIGTRKCIIGAAKAWQLPKPDNGKSTADVSYPFYLK